MPASCSYRHLVRVGVMLLATSLLVLSGCSWLPSRDDGANANEPLALDTDFVRSRLIVRDVVGTLIQIPSLSPRRTTLVANPPENRFGELLVAALQDAGYDLRVGAASGQAGQVSWRIDPSREANAQRDDWTVIVGARDVRIKRSYRADVDGVQPISSMYVHGADPSRLTVDRSLFARSPLAPVAQVVPNLLAEAPEAAAGKPVVVVTPVPATRSMKRSPTAIIDAPESPSNMYLTGRSRYQPLFATFEPIGDAVMVFPNDSLVMGRENKRVARLMAARFDPTRDVISVVGCSHGTTALEDGNALLANGRSLRVKEEFMRAGIDEDLVLEEGCWAGVAYSRMPARGVVVTHRRRDG